MNVIRQCMIVRSCVFLTLPFLDGAWKGPGRHNVIMSRCLCIRQFCTIMNFLEPFIAVYTYYPYYLWEERNQKPRLLYRPDLICLDLTWPVPSYLDLFCHDLTCPVLIQLVPASAVTISPESTWPVLTWPVLTWPVLTWSVLTWYIFQTLSRHSPDTLQANSRHPLDTFQTLSRHLPDTLQTPLKYPQDTQQTPSKFQLPSFHRNKRN